MQPFGVVTDFSACCRGENRTSPPLGMNNGKTVVWRMNNHGVGKQLWLSCPSTWRIRRAGAPSVWLKHRRGWCDTLDKYADAFNQGNMDLDHTSLVRHTIDTGDSRPIKQLPRWIAPAKREEMHRAVNEMAALGLIDMSDSPWSSPIVLVTKKDGSTLFCLDYRALNQVTVKDSYLPPRIDDTLDDWRGCSGSLLSTWSRDNIRWRWQRRTRKR